MQRGTEAGRGGASSLSLAVAATAAAALRPSALASGGWSGTQQLASIFPARSITKKAAAADPRLVVGAVVQTKALNVINYMEVSRFKGALAKVVSVDGKVLEVVHGRSKGPLRPPLLKRRQATSSSPSSCWKGLLRR